MQPYPSDPNQPIQPAQPPLPSSPNQPPVQYPPSQYPPYQQPPQYSQDLPPQYPPAQPYPPYQQPAPQYSQDLPPQYPPVQPYQQAGYAQQAPYQYPPQYPQQPIPPIKPKQNLGLIGGIAAAVIVVLLLIIVLAAVNHNNSNQANAPIPTTAAQQPQPTTAATAAATTAPDQPTPTSAVATPTSSSTSQTYKVGDTITLDGWQVTLNSVTTSNGDDFDTPDAGNRYLIAVVTLKNLTGQPQVASSFAFFNLQDNAGQRYDETFLDNVSSSPDGTVPANGLLKGSLPYEVPISMKSYTLSFTPSMESTDESIWAFTIQ